jgi:hypothetical protein
MHQYQMNKSLTYIPSSESSDDEEENSEEILLHRPSFSINDDEGASACHIICRIVNKQLKHLLRHVNHLPQMIPHRQQSTNITYSLEGI